MANGINGEMPYWAKTLTYLIKEIGLPSLMVLLVFGMWIGWLDSPIQQQHLEVLDNQKITLKYLDLNQKLINSSAKRTQELVEINRVTCVNAAETNEQRKQCIQPGS